MGIVSGAEYDNREEKGVENTMTQENNTNKETNDKKHLSNKSSALIGFILLGVIPTIILFATHDLRCKYDMNPLCFLGCVWPLIVGLPLLDWV